MTEKVAEVGVCFSTKMSEPISLRILIDAFNFLILSMFRDVNKK